MVSLVVIVCSLFRLAAAEEFPQPTLEQIDPAGISGSLVICGGGALPESIFATFFQLAGEAEARLIVVTTASGNAESLDQELLVETWQQRGFTHIEVLHTRDRSVANSEEFVAPLQAATAVWFNGGQQSRLAEAYVGTRVEQELMRLLSRGGVIGGTSAGAAIQSRLMIASGNPHAKLMSGLDLVPGAVIDQHFKVRNRFPRSKSVIDRHPGYFGLGIDEGTAIVVRGRRIQVLGESTVTVYQRAGAARPADRYELAAGDEADLTALRRAAIFRAEEAYPPRQMPVPLVEHGSLMIVGGGRISQDLWKTFVELAGGAQSKIVVVPTASERPLTSVRGDLKLIIDAGAGEVAVLHTRSRLEADTETFRKPLQVATGVWFTGGRQWRLVDAYAGTKTEAAFHDVLKRGGVIGGTSAGATIQGDYLVRGNPLGNQDMMADGYERGFAFLPGVAIDQHFSQRDRQSDMVALKTRFPQILGIGIDEGTAIVVHKNQAQVIGENSVFFYDTPAAQDARQLAPHASFTFHRVASK